MEYRSLYITAGSAEEAKRLARALVEERLAACVNVLPAVTSFYRWEEAVQEESEAVLIAKTRADRVQAASARIKALHSYTVPCIVALPILGGNPEFLSWIEAEAEPRR